MRYFLLILAFILISNPSFSKHGNVVLPVIAHSSTSKDDDKKELLKESVFSGLKLRNIGPGITGGRIVDIAVNPKYKNIFYVAVACGGVFKTTNSGISFTPVFDGQKSFSIGCITIDERNPHIVWVGSGENNSQRSVSYGDGIYKSSDDGKTWKNMGLNKSEHIGKIVIDQKNSDIVYVAVQGPLWGPGGDRGLYKTTDAGKTWNKSLDISVNTGVTDVAIDPRDHKILYAASYQRRRHVWTLIDGGPESAIYKSVDEGKTWDKLTNGLPGGVLGRIGIAVSPVNHDILYATIEATEGGGIFRSTDQGASWNKQNEWFSGAAQYYQEIFCDPKVLDRIYLVDTYTRVSEDGGKTLSVLGLKEKHVDDHAVWIDPDNSEHIMVGCDGGLYESYDRAQTWRFFENMSITQFYRVTCDNSEPFYYVYGGTQDNNSLGGPSRTTNSAGILNQDWFYTIGGDGFKTVIDPEDPNIIYSQPQYGWLARYDKKSGELTGIQPQPEKREELRWNWDSPVIISPFSHTRLYFAANRLFRTDDRGNSWKAISPDLTRQIDRNQLKVMDKLWDPEAVAKNASTSLYGNIVSLCESPVKENLIYVGTDDGLIQVTENAGDNWTKIESFDNVPETTYVSDICASQFDENVVYATFDNHKNNDFKPYVLKSSDKGKSWHSISSNLPENLPVYSIIEDFVKSDLLFIGTEFGLYFTVDGGGKWFALNNGMPAMSIRDLDIQKRESDLALASFGRGFWILDDYSPLRQIDEQSLTYDAIIFPVKDALIYNMNDSWGRRTMGENFFRLPNPDFGAVFTYYLKDAPKTLKQIRKDKEKADTAKGGLITYPTPEQLRAEDEEEAAYLLFTITDENGLEIRRIKTAAVAGINRINWDLKYPDTAPVDAGTDINKYSGMFVLPGKYNVSMSLYKNGETKLLAGPMAFNTKLLNNVSLPASDKKALADFQKDVLGLQRALGATQKVFNDLKAKIKPIKAAILGTEGSKEDMLTSIHKIEMELNDVEISLNGDASKGKRNDNQTPSISDRTGNIIDGISGTSSEPTQIAKVNYKIAGKQLEEVIDRINKIINDEVIPLEKQLDKLNAPWTPGRMPVWKVK